MYGIEGCIEILNNPGQSEKIVEATLLDVVHRAAATAKAAERFPHFQGLESNKYLLAKAASEESTKNDNAALDNKALNFLMESRVALACTTSDRILSAP